jgi:hypothetical protein
MRYIIVTFEDGDEGPRVYATDDEAKVDQFLENFAETRRLGEHWIRLIDTAEPDALDDLDGELKAMRQLSGIVFS